QSALGPLLEPGLAQELERLVVVAGRELEVHGLRGAALQQLDLDLADTAADLEDARSLDAAPLEEVDHLLRGLVEAPLAVAPRDAPREARVEEPVAAAGVAAARHEPMISDPCQAAAMRRVLALPL